MIINLLKFNIFIFFMQISFSPPYEIKISAVIGLWKLWNTFFIVFQVGVVNL